MTLTGEDQRERSGAEPAILLQRTLTRDRLSSNRVADVGRPPADAGEVMGSRRRRGTCGAEPSTDVSSSGEVGSEPQAPERLSGNAFASGT